MLQHGSILLERLDIDETDLLRGAPGRGVLRAATITLGELDAPTDVATVAAAVAAGFASALDLSFISTNWASAPT